MINNQKVLAVIPARGGSKGLPGKNIKLFAGKPLIHWTIEAASQSSYIDKVVVSTDSEEIKAVAEQLGELVPYLRDAHLSNDSASMADVIEDLCQHCQGYSYIIILQPTSPLRGAAEIDQMFQQFTVENADSYVSVCEAEKSPYWMYELGADNTLHSILGASNATCRQKLPKAYLLNGAMYLFSVEGFMEHKKFVTDETKAFVMSRHLSADIDTLEDFVHAENIFKQIRIAK